MKVESDGQEFNRYLQKDKMTSQRKSLNTKKTTTHADGNKGPVFGKAQKVAVIYQLMKSQPRGKPKERNNTNSFTKKKKKKKKKRENDRQQKHARSYPVTLW